MCQCEACYATRAAMARAVEEVLEALRPLQTEIAKLLVLKAAVGLVEAEGDDEG